MADDGQSGRFYVRIVRACERFPTVERMMQPAPGRPEAAAAIWKWQRPEDGRDTPDEASGRVRGVVQATIGAAVGGALYAFVSTAVGTVVLSIAGLIGLAALLSPRIAFRGIEHAFETLGRWLGIGLTWLLLPLLFYTFFVPFRALFRRGRRDSMQRDYDAEATTYWSGRDQGRSGSGSALKQY
jgi:hypothetical protein